MSAAHDRYLDLVAEQPSRAAGKRTQPERALQSAIVQAIRLTHPKVFICHIPLGGERDKREAIGLQRMGVTAGVADLLVIWPDGRCGFLEVKHGRLTPSSLSPAQQGFRDMCRERGVAWAVVTSIDQALAFVSREPL